MSSAEVKSLLQKYKQVILRYKSPEDPRLAPVYSRSAALEIALEDYHDAIMSAQLSSQLDPYHAAAWFQLSHCYYMLEQYEKAGQTLVDGLQHNPGNHRLITALTNLRQFQSETLVAT